MDKHIIRVVAIMVILGGAVGCGCMLLPIIIMPFWANFIIGAVLSFSLGWFIGNIFRKYGW